MKRLRGVAGMPWTGWATAASPVKDGLAGADGIGTGGVTGNGSAACAPGAIAIKTKKIRKVA